MVLEDSVILTGPNFFQEFLNDALVTPTGGAQVALADALANAALNVPGGSNGFIQYNNSGHFGGIATTGSGSAVLGTSPSLATPTVASGALSGTFTGNHIYSGQVTLSNTTTIVGPASGGAFIKNQTGNTGGMSFQVDSATANINFSAGGTTVGSITQATSTFNNKLVLNPTSTTSSVAPFNRGFSQVQTWTGDSGSTGTSINALTITDRTQTTSAAGSQVLAIQHISDSALATGTRISCGITYSHTAASGNLTSKIYVALAPLAKASSNDNGTNTGWGTANAGNGSLTCFNPQAILNPGATWWAGINGMEVNTGIANTASVNVRRGMSVVDVNFASNTTTAQGAFLDIAFSLNNQYTQTAGKGWKQGFMFGDDIGFFPMDQAGLMIGAGSSGGTMLADTGIDFSNVTFATAFIKSAGFSVDGSGNTNALTYKVSSTKVVGARITGWGAATNGAKTAFNGSTATLAQTSAAVAQLIADLTTHGLIGT